MLREINRLHQLRPDAKVLTWSFFTQEKVYHKNLLEIYLKIQARNPAMNEDFILC